MRRHVLAGLSILLLLATFAMSGCQLYYRESWNMHGQCATATTCSITLVSGADSTNTLDWSVTASNSRVIISPSSGTIRPGTSVSITIILPSGVCPIDLHGAEMNGTEQAGLWSASVTEQDPLSQRCENVLLAHPF